MGNTKVKNNRRSKQTCVLMMNPPMQHTMMLKPKHSVLDVVV
jgi:hypothetical protein